MTGDQGDQNSTCLTAELANKLIQVDAGWAGRYSPAEILRLVDQFGCTATPASAWMVKRCRGSGDLFATNEPWWFYFTAPPGVVQKRRF